VARELDSRPKELFHCYCKAQIAGASSKEISCRFTFGVVFGGVGQLPFSHNLPYER
jgi:hypothetical protein